MTCCLTVLEVLVSHFSPLNIQMLFLSVLITVKAVSCRLVLDSWADIYREDGSVDVDKLDSEADIVGVTRKPYPECPEVNIEVTEYEMFLRVDGEEVRDTLKKQELSDLRNTTKTIMSTTEPWIKGDIMLRFGQNIFQVQSLQFNSLVKT